MCRCEGVLVSCESGEAVIMKLWMRARRSSLESIFNKTIDEYGELDLKRGLDVFYISFRFYNKIIEGIDLYLLVSQMSIPR